jgi:peptide/nickel transport system permease protein
VIFLSILIFALARLSPGDPLAAYYGDGVERMNAAERETAIRRLALDDPLPTQYLRWAQNALRGDFGISYQYKQDVMQVIARVWPNTLLLGGLSYVLTFAFSVLLGVFCAAREGGAADRLIGRAGLIVNCVPTFFMALLLIAIFGVTLGLLPTSGAFSTGKSGDFADRAAHLILPLAVMILSHLWYYAYMIRNKMLEELRMDYVLLLRVKGVGKPRILFGHCLKNILPSILAMMAVSAAHIIGGTYVVEMVFSYPGLGTLSFESARYSDYNMLSILCLITGVVVISVNLLGQTVSERIDPRMRAADRETARLWPPRTLS